MWGVSLRIFALACGNFGLVRFTQRITKGLNAATVMPTTINIRPVGSGSGKVIAPIAKMIKPTGNDIQRSRVLIGFGTLIPNTLKLSLA